VELAEEETAAIRASIEKLKHEEAELRQANRESEHCMLMQSSFAPKLFKPS